MEPQVRSRLHVNPLAEEYAVLPDTPNWDEVCFIISRTFLFVHLTKLFARKHHAESWSSRTARLQLGELVGL